MSVCRKANLPRVKWNWCFRLGYRQAIDVDKADLFTLNAADMVTYKIQIQPSQEVADYVAERKSLVFEKFGQYEFCKSHPQITLFHFRAEMVHEYFIVRALKEAASLVNPLDICLNGFSYISEERAIYLKAENGMKIASMNRLLSRKFREAALEFGVEMTDVQVPGHSHMCVGSHFGQEAFLALHEAFVSQSYQASFSADRISLMRDIGNGSNQPVESIAFNAKAAISLKWPEPKVHMVGEPQMSLFSYVA